MSTAQPQVTGPATKVVTITPGNPPSVSDESVTIHRSQNEQVRWECADCSSGFQVNFADGSPFEDPSFDTSKTKDKGRAASGRARANADLKQYKYSVTVDGKTLDPVLILQP